jgi:electron transfer flavoprotein-quinone oxidoreductase
MVMPGVRVDGLLTEGNRIVGVQAGEDELHAHVVVAADGVNSFIARNAGLRATPSTDQLAVGIKALIKLPKADIEARFGVSEDHGVAYSLVGDCSQGVGGGGFLYTNRDSLSAGLVLRLDDLVAKGRRSIDLFDHFLAHPFIDQLVRGGELVEYGCHLVAEGGEAMQGQLVHNGLIIVGDAAGFTLNTGLTVRGMDLAVGSARAAAPAIAAAIADKDPSAARLAAYTENLKTSYVGQDMRTYAKAPHFLENERMYGAYGALLADVMNRLFYLDTSPRKHLVATAREALKASGLGLLTLGRDGWEGMRAL